MIIDDDDDDDGVLLLGKRRRGRRRRAELLRKNGFDGWGDVEGPKRFCLHELAKNTMRRTFWYLRAVDDERNVLGRL